MDTSDQLRQLVEDLTKALKDAQEQIKAGRECRMALQDIAYGVEELEDLYPSLYVSAVNAITKAKEVGL